MHRGWFFFFFFEWEDIPLLKFSIQNTHKGSIQQGCISLLNVALLAGRYLPGEAFRKYIRGASGRERMLLSNWKSRKMTFTADVSIKRVELLTLQPPLTRKNESLPTTRTITSFCLRLFQPSGTVSRNQHGEGMNSLQHVSIMDPDTRLTPMRNFTTSTVTICFDTMLATLICASKEFH